MVGTLLIDFFEFVLPACACCRRTLNANSAYQNPAYRKAVGLRKAHILRRVRPRCKLPLTVRVEIVSQEQRAKGPGEGLQKRDMSKVLNKYELQFFLLR